MFEEKFFVNRKPNKTKLLDYGFIPSENGYIYKSALLEDQLELTVAVAPDGGVSTRVTDVSTGEDYYLYKVPSSVGAFVGKVKSLCEDALADISEKCCDPDVFKFRQTAAAIGYVREKLGGELEFLWDKFPDNAIWRREDNRKWYGLVITIQKRKLGLDSDDITEAVVLRLEPEFMEKTVDNKRYFPGWHMNKKSWYTIILDGSVPDEEIFCRIERSRRLAAK